MLCTSGFVNDVMFSYNGPKARRVYFYTATEHNKHNNQDSDQILLSTIKTGSTHCELRTGGEVCYLRMTCWSTLVVYVLETAVGHNESAQPVNGRKSP